MKKLVILSCAAVLSLIASAGSSQAQTTSIQFTQHPYIGTDLTSGQTAGFGTPYAASNWNVVDPIGANGMVYLGGATQTYSGSGLVTSTGAASGLSYTAVSGGPAGSTPGQVNTANNTLLSSGLSTDGAGNTNGWYAAPATLTVNGLNAGNTYTIVAYVEGSNYNLGEASLSLSSGGPTEYFTSALGGFAATAQTTLVSNPSTTDLSLTYANNPGGASAFASNYVVFTGVTGVSSDELSLTSLGSWPGGVFEPTSTGGYIFSLSGVQIIDTSAAPEPSAILLMGVGLVGLVFFVRRKSAVRS